MYYCKLPPEIQVSLFVYITVNIELHKRVLFEYDFLWSIVLKYNNSNSQTRSISNLSLFPTLKPWQEEPLKKASTTTSIQMLKFGSAHLLICPPIKSTWAK